ncbi:hypothetical protein NUW58_g6953 [Xylaria curta]|uniref:Uncharacterized protein n=1 Tax=Xylaria curta TaxID=42375 RepID=A0ACC1NMU1_9PEZI|nr:hypothetical protein NUW58_g6953 [Xylaria curta]
MQDTDEHALGTGRLGHEEMSSVHSVCGKHCHARFHWGGLQRGTRVIRHWAVEVEVEVEIEAKQSRGDEVGVTIVEDMASSYIASSIRDSTSTNASAQTRQAGFRPGR